MNRIIFLSKIESFDLKNRKDKFSLWFTGETLFVKGDERYINEESYYDEYRSFSILNGVRWKDAIRCSI